MTYSVENMKSAFILMGEKGDSWSLCFFSEVMVLSYSTSGRPSYITLNISHLNTSEIFGSVRLTREEVSLEAPLGHGVVWLELDPHVVLLGGDDLGFLSSAELPMKLRVRAQPTAHLHIIIFTHLVVNTRGFYLPSTKDCKTLAGYLMHCLQRDHDKLPLNRNTSQTAFTTVYSHRSLRSQTHQTPEWCDTEWAPQAATCSSCWVGILWASRGWWVSRSAWWWTHHRQLLVGENTDFSGGRVKDRHLYHINYKGCVWIKDLFNLFFTCRQRWALELHN